MCGICGTASTGRAAEPAGLDAMSATLVHRGPDSDGVYVDGPVGLAARRLSIIDLETGDQPIANEDGSVVVVQNGEIYNYEELRASWSARATASARTATPRCSSTPTRSGASGSPSGCAACSRSRSGTRARGGSYSRATASGSSRSTTASTATRSTSRPSCVRCRAARSTSTRSRPFSRSTASRRRFRSSATRASCRRGTCSSGTARSQLQRFARPAPALETRNDDEAELVEELRARLRDSVRAHLVSDVPVGVLLSGGVDSGVLAALAAEETSEPLRTFSIGFEERSFDELADARLVAERYGTRPPRARAASGRCAAAARARGSVRRAVRRLVGAADVPRLRARGGRREGGAVGRGRRRAVRRLLHLRRALLARGWGRCPLVGRSSSGCRRRRARRASTTARSASCERRTSRRSSGTTAGRRSSPPTRAPS